VARGESPAAAVELGRRVAPDSAEIALHDAAGVVAVDVVAPVRGPGGVLGFLPPVRVSSRAVTAEEGP
jgi:hypothetical protein